MQRLAGWIARGMKVAREALTQVGHDVQDLRAVDGLLKPSDEATGEEREGQCVSLWQEWEASVDPMHQPCAKVMSRCEPGVFVGERGPIFQQTLGMWSVGSQVPQATSVGCMVVAMRVFGWCSKVQHCCGHLMRMGIIMAHVRVMTWSLPVRAVCQQASRRPSNAARSCAKRGPERNALCCSQTLKNGMLTRPSL